MKRPDAEAVPECYAFGGSGFPLCSLPLAAACRCAAAVYRRAAAVCRLVVAVCCCIALAYLRVGRFHRRFTLMLRAFSGGGGGLSAAKAHDDIPSVITAESKANFFIAISFLQMYRRISSGKSEDKMEKSLFGPLCIPLRLLALRRSSAGETAGLWRPASVRYLPRARSATADV